MNERVDRTPFSHLPAAAAAAAVPGAANKAVDKDVEPGTLCVSRLHGHDGDLLTGVAS